MQQALTKTCPGQVPAPGHGARVLPLELVPVPGHGAQICARGRQQKAMIRLVSVPGHRAWAPSLNRALDFG